MQDDMKMIIAHLQRTEGYSRAEAIEAFREMREEVAAGADPEEVLYEIGLEPDFVFGLI